MDRTLHVGTISVALLLTIGSIFFASSAVMWLASSFIVMNLVRIVLVGALLYVLVNDREFGEQARQLLAVSSVACLIWALGVTFNGGVNVLDAVLFTQASVSFGLAALVRKPKLAPAKYQLIDVDDGFRYQPVFGIASNLWRQFQPEIVSSGLVTIRNLTKKSSTPPVYSAVKKKAKNLQVNEEIQTNSKEAFA